MAKQHTVTSYQFDELSAEAKEVARDWYREGALDYEWWESTYEDAARIGLKITGFDLGRGQTLEAKLTRSTVDVAKAILKDHGKDTDTYALAEAFLDEIDGIDLEDPESEQEHHFLVDLRHEYWHILNREQEYLLSDESVDESIRANEYDFTADGRRFRL